MSTRCKITSTAGAFLLVTLLGASGTQAGPLDLFNRKLKQSARFLRQVQARRLPVKIQPGYSRALSAESPKRSALPRTLGDGGPGSVTLERRTSDAKLGVTINRPNPDIRSIYRTYRLPGVREKRAVLESQNVTYSNGLMVHTTFGESGRHSFFLEGDLYDAIHHSQPRFDRSARRPNKPDLFKARRIPGPAARSTALVGAGGLAMVGGVALGGTPVGPLLFFGGALTGVGGLIDNHSH